MNIYILEIILTSFKLSCVSLLIVNYTLSFPHENIMYRRGPIQGNYPPLLGVLPGVIFVDLLEFFLHQVSNPQMPPCQKSLPLLPLSSHQPNSFSSHHCQALVYPEKNHVSPPLLIF